MLISMARTIAPALMATTLVATANAGQSSVLASPSIHAAAHQYDAHCTLFNADARPVTVKTVQILEGAAGTVVKTQENDCQPKALGSLKGCRIRVSVQPDHRYSCVAFILPDASLVRGALELRDNTDTVIQNVELR